MDNILLKIASAILGALITWGIWGLHDCFVLDMKIKQLLIDQLERHK